MSRISIQTDYTDLNQLEERLTDLNKISLSSVTYEEGIAIINEISRIHAILDSSKQEILTEDEEKRLERLKGYTEYLSVLNESPLEEKEEKEKEVCIHGSYYKQIKKRKEDGFEPNDKNIYIYDFYNEIDNIYNYLKTNEKYDFGYVVTKLLNLITNLELEIKFTNPQSNLVINISYNQCEKFIEGLNEIIYIIKSIQDEYMGCEGEDCSEFMDSDDINEILKKLNELTSQGISEEKNKVYNENRRKKRKSISPREVKKKKYFELKKQGLSNSEIAKEMGISNQAVRQFFKRHEK